MKILITINNRSDQAILQHYINKYFVCELIFTLSHQESIEKLVTESPDVIICDTSNNFSNEFINYIINKNFNIPVVALINSSEEIEGLIKSGVLSFLPKPLNSFFIYKQLEKVFHLRVA